MKQEEVINWAKRFSVKQLTEKTEKEIFQVLPLHSQPIQDSPTRIHIHVRRFSKPVFPITQTSPRNQTQKKLPPILRYLSQKYMKQSELRKEDDNSDKDEKIFNINTRSLRKLQPYRNQHASIPRKKGKNIVNRNSIEEIALQRLFGKKIQTKVSNKNRRYEYIQKKINTDRVPSDTSTNKNEKISGWNIQEFYEIQAYQ